jgi:hypothetical protein
MSLRAVRLKPSPKRWGVGSRGPERGIILAPAPTPDSRNMTPDQQRFRKVKKRDWQLSGFLGIVASFHQSTHALRSPTARARVTVHAKRRHLVS